MGQLLTSLQVTSLHLFFSFFFLLVFFSSLLSLPTPSFSFAKDHDLRFLNSPSHPPQRLSPFDHRSETNTTQHLFFFFFLIHKTNRSRQDGRACERQERVRSLKARGKMQKTSGNKAAAFEEVRYFGYPGRQHRMEEIPFKNWSEIVLWKTTLVLVRIAVTEPQTTEEIFLQVKVNDPCHRVRLMPEASAAFQQLSFDCFSASHQSPLPSSFVTPSEALISTEHGEETTGYNVMCIKVGPSGLVPVSLSVDYTKGKARVEASLSFRLLARPPQDVGEDRAGLIDEIDVKFLVQNCHYAQRSSRLSQTPLSSLLTFVSSRAIRELSTAPQTSARQRRSTRTRRRGKKTRDETRRAKTVKQTKHRFPSFSSSCSSESAQLPDGLSTGSAVLDVIENLGLTQKAPDMDKGKEKQEKSGQTLSSLSSSSSSVFFSSGSGHSCSLSSSSSSSFLSSSSSSLTVGVDERAVREWEDVLGKMECSSFLSAEIGSVQFFSSSPLPFSSVPSPFSFSSPAPFPFSLPFRPPSH